MHEHEHEHDGEDGTRETHVVPRALASTHPSIPILAAPGKMVISGPLSKSYQPWRARALLVVGATWQPATSPIGPKPKALERIGFEKNAQRPARSILPPRQEGTSNQTGGPRFDSGSAGMDAE